MQKPDNLFADQYPEESREYALSEMEKTARKAHAFDVIVHLAKTLKPAEVQVLLALTALFINEEHKSGKVSSRDLAEATNTARKNVRLALNTLTAKNLIAVRAGTTKQPAGYGLTFLRIKPMGIAVPPVVATKSGQPDATTGPEVGTKSAHPGEDPVGTLSAQGGYEECPGVGTLSAQGGYEECPGVGTLSAQGGYEECPPHTGERARAAGADSIRFDSISTRSNPRASLEENSNPVDFERPSVIERVMSARPSQFHKSDLRTVYDEVYGFHAKMAQLYGKPQPQPPDMNLVAQLLAMGSVSEIQRMFCDLRADRPSPRNTYGYYAVVAMNRLHGIPPDVFRAGKRRALHIEPVRHKASPVGEQQPLSLAECEVQTSTDEFLDAVHAKAKRSKL